MVRNDRWVGAVLSLVILLADSAAGQVEPVADAGETGGSPLVPDDLEEVEEALGTLNAAGVPPTREDLARFLAEVKEGGTGSGKFAVPRWFQGAFKYRLGHYRDEGLDHYGKVSLEIPWLRVRGRVREYRSGLRETTGVVELGPGPVELRIGDLGLSHGFGLLVGPPGRGSTLAADSGFSPSAERLVTWLGAEDPRALSGYGGAVRLGSWSLRFVREGLGEGVPDRGLRNTAAQVGVRGGNWRLSVAGQYRDAAGGASLSTGIAKGRFSGSCEAMVFKPAPGVPPAGAAVVQVKWSPVRGSGLEGQFGFADLAAAPELSRRPGVLPGWAGRGLAVRGFTRTGSGVVLKALLHLGRHLDRRGTRSRNTKMLVDLQGSRKLIPAVQLALRFRRDTRAAWEWSVRYPWQAPLPQEPYHRTIVSAQVVFEENQSRGRLMLRSYSLENGSAGGRRSLVGLSGRRVVGRGWRLRGTWVSAWGDPVDLVSAVSPLTGMVLPRHWGLWRSETVLGLERFGRMMRLQAAVSLRHPERGLEGGPVPTFWAEAGIRW
ncbi:MAG: hypothetical protein ABFS42_09540 [Candidatus Krumholzibacteriota bacterium]